MGCGGDTPSDTKTRPGNEDALPGSKKVPRGTAGWNEKGESAASHLETSQGDLEGNVQRAVDDAGDGLDQGHEEQREPDDADEQHHDHPAHPVLHHLLLLLPPRLRVPLQRREMKEKRWGGGVLHYIWSAWGPVPRGDYSSTFSDSRQHLRMKM